MQPVSALGLGCRTWTVAQLSVREAAAWKGPAENTTSECVSVSHTLVLKSVMAKITSGKEERGPAYP